MDSWHDNGISIVVDVAAVGMIIALMMNNSMNSAQGQLVGFGLGLLALFFAVSAIQEVFDILSND